MSWKARISVRALTGRGEALAGDFVGGQHVGIDRGREACGHDQRAIHESKIADNANSFFANGKRATSITGNMITEDDSAWRVAAKMSENLRSFAIEAFPKNDIVGNRVRPPIILHASLLVDVAHDGKLPAV